MKRMWAWSGIILLLVAIIYFDTLNVVYGVEPNSTVIINCSLANLRSGPGTTYNKVGEVRKGECLTVLEGAGDWYQVKTSNGTVAYISASLADKSETSVQPPVAPTVTVNSSSSATTVQDMVQVRLNQTILIFDVPPIIENGRTLVPLRAIFEALGATVEWDASNQKVRASRAGTVVEMTIGSLHPTVNGQDWPLDVPARAVSQRTLAPLRFVGEVFGGQVSWDKENRLVSIDTPQPVIQDHQGEELSLDYHCNSDGIRLIMQCSSSPDLNISENGNNTTYRYDGCYIREDKTFKEKSGLGAISIQARNQGKAVVVQIVLPAGLEHQCSQEFDDRKQVFFIPNSVLGLERQPMGRSGERIVVNTLLPVTYTSSLDGNTIYINLPNVRRGKVQDSYSYDSCCLKTLQVQQKGQDFTQIKIDTREKAKYSIGQNHDDQSLYVLLVNQSDLPAPNSIVILDPGHGGKEPGTSGQTVIERQINLPIALKVGVMLSQKGIQVDYTRRDDSYVSLEERPAMANLLNAALYISIHNNGFGDHTVNGTETFFYAPPESPQLFRQKAERERLANLIQQRLINSLGLPDRGAKQENLLVLRNCEVPCALTEIAFLSNPDGEKLLQQESFQKQAASAIAEAIAEFMQSSK